VLAAVGSEGSQQSADPVTGLRHWTALFIVASPRPSTGKTFLARLVTDFLRMDGGAVEVFQLSPGDIALADLLPGHAAPADLDSTPAQMALFDRLIQADGVAKVVDLGTASFERFFTLAEEIGFIDAARGRVIETIVLFAADPHPKSVKVYADLLHRFPRMVLVPVFNDAILKGRKLREQYPFARAAAVPLQIPALPPPLNREVERSGLSFVDFHNQLPVAVPIGPAFELRSWTKRTFLEFRELELRLLLEKLRASLSDRS
jgi:hypothetical protein